MNTVIADLWPDQIGKDVDVVAPVAILRQQASLLGTKTHNLVEAQVNSEAIDDEFYHGFYIVAPALHNYRYRLFRVRHPIDLYPLQIDEVGSKDEWTDIHSEDELVDTLRQILSSDRATRIVNSLIALSQGVAA